MKNESLILNKVLKNMDVTPRKKNTHRSVYKEDLKRLCSQMISSQMDLLGFKQEQIAELLAVTRGNIGHYVAGRRLPSLEIFLQFLKIFGLENKPISEILAIDKLNVPEANINRPLINKCPVLSWGEAINWPQNRDEINIIEQLSEQIIIGINCYALKIKDDLMISHAEAKVFKEGAYIIVDPDKKYENRSLVVAKKGDELIFREYRNDAGYECLAFFKDAHPRRIIDLTPDIKICGVVIAYLDTLNKGN